MATRGRPAFPIEIERRGGSPLGMPPSSFLRDYWQKRPLLIRQAYPGFESPVDANDLAGLACEDVAPSRIVIRKPRGTQWQVLHGPFDETRFAALPRSHWTLLVQDCDKLLGEVGELLRRFRFVPDWRVDDVMISYAVDGGSVGAHLDQYDVFLLQAQGRRRWGISVDPRAPVDFRPDQPLKLLRAFAPTHEWVLEPGDMLYLPPGVPHHGVAEGECMTWSIGMRAPAVGEMLIDFAERYAERHAETPRYSDPGLSEQEDAAEITADALAAASALLRDALDTDGEVLADWFARFVTRYRSAHDAAPPRRPLDDAALQKRLRAGSELHRSPWSRIAFLRGPGRGRAVLYLAGEPYPCSLELARILTQDQRWDHAALAAIAASDWPTVAQLHNDGHLVLARA